MGYGPDEPRVSATAITDPAAGVTAAGALLTALWRRDRTGEGALIDLSQGEAMSAYLGEQFVQAQLGRSRAATPRQREREIAPHGVYRCAGEDEWIAIAARTKRSGARWTRSPASAGGATRTSPRPPHPSNTAPCSTKAIEAWTGRSGEARADGDADGRGRARGSGGLPRRVDGRPAPAGGVATSPGCRWRRRGHGPRNGSPLHFDGIRTYEAWRGAPRLGGTTARVLAHWGTSTAEIETLEAAAVLADAPPA